jgi:hypothetical protein
MPMDFMNKGIGSKIGASLGKVKEVEVANDDVGWGRYLRLKVVIDLFQPLDWGRSLTLEGKSYWVQLKYEKLPAFCFKCGRVLHATLGCPIPSSKRANHKVGVWGWGSWIRAEDQSKIPEKVEGYQDDDQPQPPVEKEDDGDGSLPSNNDKSSHNGKSFMRINSKAEILESKSVADPKPS